MVSQQAEALLAGPSETQSSAPTPTPTLGTGLRLWASLALLIALTVGDGVLVVILFDTWGETFALFINQGTALVYIVWSTLVLCGTRARFHGGVPWYVLVAIGIFNGSANFLTAISQPHTPGLSQTLLSLLVIPLVLALSWVFLAKRPSPIATCGAALIVGGSAVSALRSVVDSGGGGSSPPIVAYGWAIALYGLSNVFLAGEKVFEERVFRDSHHAVRPMQMFFWTLVTQFLLGWGLYPLQTFDAFGGIELTRLPELLSNGSLCAVGQTSSGQIGSWCTPSHAAIFWSYCAVDFCCYYYGLHVIQRGGANLQVLAAAIALPLQQLVLCARPLVGEWAEDFFWGDAAALCLVLLGFSVYQLSREGRAVRSTSQRDHRRGEREPES